MQKAHSPCGDKAAGLWNEMLLDGSSGQAEPRNGLPNGACSSYTLCLSFKGIGFTAPL